MGRSLNNGFGNLGSTGTTGSSQTIVGIAGNQTIATNDLLLLGPEGTLFPANTVDYCTVGNAGSVVSLTNPGGAFYFNYTGGYNSSKIIQSQNGDLISAAPYGANTGGVAVFKYTASGTVIASLNITASGAASAYSVKLGLLSNGNIVVTYMMSNNTYFAIFNPNSMNMVTSPTVITACANTASYAMIPLSGGGFMVVFQHDATRTSSRISIYTNTGSLSVSSATLASWTGSVGIVLHNLVELSNGNVAIAMASAFTTTSGLYIAVVSSGGTTIVSPTQVVTTTSTASYASSPWIPQIVAISGYFAVATINTSASRVDAGVFNNAGVQQGVNFNSLGSVPGTLQYISPFSLTGEGSNFWLTYYTGTSTKAIIAKIPNTGTDYATYTTTITFGADAVDIDSEVKQGILVFSWSDDDIAGNYGYAIWNVNSQAISASGSSPFGQPGVKALGDFTFALSTVGSASNGMGFLIRKVADTSVAGVASQSSSAGGTAKATSGAGAYSVNTLKGSPNKAFDHYATNVVGNKGTVLKYSVVLKGF